MMPGMASNDPRRGALPPEALNGHLPKAADRALSAAAEAMAKTLAETLAGALPQALFQAVAAALQQVQVTVTPFQCATCVLEQLQWGHQHAAEIARANAALQAEAARIEGLPPEERPSLDPLGFLPEHLRPGGSQGAVPVQPAAVQVGGTLLCTGHIPGAPGQPGKKPYLIAAASLTPSMMAQFMAA